MISTKLVTLAIGAILLAMASTVRLMSKPPCKREAPPAPPLRRHGIILDFSSGLAVYP
jgi:hypothetical protein